MGLKDNDTGETQLRKHLEELTIMMESQLRQYSFQNDHIMRGPLCRAVGLIDLLRRERLDPDARKLLEMLLYEMRQIENTTFMISKVLNENENRLENTKNELTIYPR